MNILCLDTSGGACSAAIARDGKVLASQYTDNGLTHSATLMGLIDGCFARARMQPAEIELVAVTNGPGSFTGLRIGMSTAKAFAHSNNCPIAQISTLQALSLPFCWAEDTAVCAMIDARHERAYASIWQAGKELLPQAIYTIEELKACLQTVDAAALVLAGDGADVYGGQLCEVLPHAKAAPAAMRYVQAAQLAAQAEAMAKAGQTVSAYDAALEYLVASQAERNLNAKQ